MDLNSLREKIDACDQQVIKLLNERVQYALEIGRIKLENGADIFVPSREEEVFQRLTQMSDGPLNEKAIRAIYRQIISAAIALEQKLVIAYLGPEATYTHHAALLNFGESVEYTPLGTIPDVFLAVTRGEAHFGVVPIENSTEGAVFHSYDMLIETDLKILAQTYLRISHCLISNDSLENIKEVLSKDNALGQCRQWLGRHLPNATLVPYNSTAKAVEYARDNPGSAAIASRVAAEKYGVPIIAENIQDKSDNVTRFLVIGKSTTPGRTGNGKDKTSFVFTLQDKAGALLRALQCFSFRGINLSKIESRPSREKTWDYYFFVDILGHKDDPMVVEAVSELETICPMVKWLGSYPNPDAR